MYPEFKFQGIQIMVKKKVLMKNCLEISLDILSFKFQSSDLLKYRKKFNEKSSICT